MKKIALVGSFCNTEEKKETLLKNIKELKSMGIDVMLISPLILPEEILTQCDYFFLTKENPVLNFPIKSMDMWKVVEFDTGSAKICFSTMDYGWTGLYQIKKLSEIALSLDYDHFYHLIYDLVIDDFVRDEIFSQKPFSFYPFIKYPSGDLFGFSLHFMSLSRENLCKVYPLINLGDYLLDPTDCGESFLHKAVLKLDGAIVEKNPVRDSINYWDDVEIFNHSPSNKTHFFVSKDFHSVETIKILFYGPHTDAEIYLRINEGEKLIQANASGLLDLGIYGREDETIEIKIDGETYDLTPVIKNLRNTLVKIQL
jgi:hypothetical protein